jgi:hypothetical protein
MIYDEVWDYIESRWGLNGLQPIGASTVIREAMYNLYLGWREADIAAEDQRRSRQRVPTTSI